MISSLPDVILIHILSLLTTKEAVATSVLSKRWIHLFLFVPNLHFPDIYVDSVESTLLFNEFVYSILVSRDTAGSNLINSFRLDIGSDNPNLAYCYGYAIRSITKWVNLVVQRKLEHLRLHFLNLDVDLSDIDNHFYDIDIDLYLPKEFPKMPVSIFTCKTLVSLDLSWFRVDGFSFSSDRFQFPSLKTLKLEHIRFLDVRDFMLLLAGCPILEDLQLSEALLRGHENPLTLQEFKTLAFPKLLRADVQICCHCFPVNALSTIKYLCINTLKVLNIVEYWYTDDHPVIRFKMVNLLQRPYDAIPIFHNLTHLVLHNRWDLVVQVLQQCPKLQSLKICKGLCDAMASEEGTKENWVEPEFVPQCLLSDLKNCTVENFSGRQSDFMLEQFILKNARILQTMTIRSRNEFSEMEKKLSICPRASTTCQLNFMFVDNI